MKEVTNPLTTKEHWRWFAEFCKFEIAAGGPDPHMRVVEWLSADEPFEEQAWRAGCYVNSYNVPSAETIWTEWPWRRVRKHRKELSAWVHEHNRKLFTTRPERRCVIGAAKFDAFLQTYADWLEREPFAALPKHPYRAYLDLWESASAVVQNGRYSKFKLLEILRRFGVPARLPDIRAAGGWSPRLALALLVPEHAEALTGDDRPTTLKVVDAVARDVQYRLTRDFDLMLDYYELEVLLCDYRQLGRRQFPGHSQDSELKYHRKVGRKSSRLFEARAALFPHTGLGELQGWADRLDERKALSYTLERHGYLWADARFDFCATTDLAKPVARP